MDATKLIKNILDVPGTEGVCFHDLDGNLIYHDMPSFMIDEVYEDLLRRVVMLYEAVETHFVPIEDYVLKFQDMNLFLRKGKDFGLLILAREDANQMSLRMVTTMAMRQLTLEALQSLDPKSPKSAVEVKASKPAPVAAAAAPATPPVPTAPQTTQPPMRLTRPPQRLYRGRTY